VIEDLLLTPAELIAVATAILTATGTQPEQANVVARSLVEANVAGHDSHGVLRLPAYVEFVERRHVDPTAEPALVFERGPVARIDGRRGWGQLAGQLAASTVVRLTRAHGVGVVAVDRCGHVGRLGEYVETLAAAGFVGHALCNAEPAVAPPGTSVRALGTNPVAWAVPRADGEPVLVDFATAELAEGKLQVAVSRGQKLNVPAVVDAAGRPSLDPADFYAGGALVPFGAHKGYALSVVAELVSRGLAAGAIDDGRDTPYGMLVLALDPAALGTAEGFLEAVERWCVGVRARAGEAGAQVTLPGDPEARARAKRREHGVPVPPAIWNTLLALRDRLEGAVLAPVEAS
jgi:LDH2 family malate/lactate/ureidoglycolate dehydrogenase